MSWKEATFKGKKVWVEVDASGQLAAQGGRVPMRYSNKKGAKLYRAGASNLKVGDGPILDLDAGVSADKAKKTSKRGSGFGKAGTRTDQQKAMAKAAARELIDSFDDDVIVCYTDGGCRGNPGPAGSGAVLQLTDGRRVEVARSLGRGTNNLAELTAIRIVLEVLEELSIPGDAPVAVLTDSSYSHGVLCKGWKAKKNTELILGIRAMLEKHPGVTLYWVAGHVGTAGNERADALANMGVAGTSVVRGLDV